MGYFVCMGGKSIRMSCLKGLVWKDVKKMCGILGKVFGEV